MKKLLLSIIFTGVAGVFVGHAEGQVTVIANPSIKSADASKSDLKDVFTGAGSSLGGSHAVPVLLRTGAANDEFVTTYIGKSSSAFLLSWRSLVFSGQASMPKSVDTDVAMVEYVANTPGAVGYIAKATPHEGVKVLAIK
jgi:ABC-type phosphate transport system substrate-binding protein